jgi:hypothetical protein
MWNWVRRGFSNAGSYDDDDDHDKAGGRLLMEWKVIRKTGKSCGLDGLILGVVGV